MSVKEIITEVNDGIGCITLNRPEQRNAISKQMWEALPATLDMVAQSGARVVILRGAGDTFAAGADLGELEELDTREKAREHWLSIRHALNAVARFQLPTIAAIEGACLGGGCLLACACDLRYCDSGAHFCVPVAQLGIVLDDDNLARLLSLIGRGYALELLLTASTIQAPRAEQIGLVNGVTAQGDLHSYVHGIAESIKQNSGPSLGANKQAIVSLCSRQLGEQDQEPMVASYLSSDFRLRISKALGRKRGS